MSGKIFINYRRGDDPGFAGRLFDRLEEAFTADRIFIDIDNIEPGLDFVRVLEDQVDRCDVLLAVIGPNWLTAKDEKGDRRLDNPNDFVRIEIESGLKLGKRIIPVLVNNAEMPRIEHLPESLQPLSRRNAVRLTHERFRADAQGLVKQLEKALADAEAARKAAASAAEEEAKRRAAEDAAKAAEAVRQEKEKARLDAISGLSAEQISKAEELANWDFIKESKEETDYRDHLARFPQGVTLRMARTRLEAILWGKLGFTPTVEALEGFLAEFPDGARAAEAAKTLAKLKDKPETTRTARVRVRKKAEPAQAALKAEPEPEPAEEPQPAPSWMRKRWIGLATVAAVYAFVVLLPSSAAFGWAGFVTAALAGGALLWWLFAPTRKAEQAGDVRPEIAAGATAAPRDEQLSWISWAYAALAVFPLLYVFVLLANDAGVSGTPEPIFFLCIAALIVAPALAFAQRAKLSGAEAGVYWLGAALGAPLAVMVDSLKSGWTWAIASSEAGGYFVLLAVIILSGAALAYWRRDRLSHVEISLYWLGSVLWLGVTAKANSTFSGWNLLGVSDLFVATRASGLLVGLVIALASALALRLYRKSKTVRGSELGVYWLGCALLALATLSWLFDAYDWNWYSESNVTNEIATGFLAGFVIAAISAAVLVYLRWPAVGALEIGCYWAGVTLAALFAFDQSNITTFTWSLRQLPLLVGAVLVAGGLVYGRNRPAAPRRK